MQPFVVNRHDRIVFPSNFVPELDLSVMHSLAQLDAVVRRDFEVNAPSGTDILGRVEEGGYSSRYDLMRDLALNLFWTNRFSMTLYEKRPTRWADVPRSRSDVFLPIVTPWADGDLAVTVGPGGHDRQEDIGPAARNISPAGGPLLIQRHREPVGPEEVQRKVAHQVIATGVAALLHPAQDVGARRRIHLEVTSDHGIKLREAVHDGQVQLRDEVGGEHDPVMTVHNEWLHGHIL